MSTYLSWSLTSSYITEPVGRKEAGLGVHHKAISPSKHEDEIRHAGWESLLVLLWLGVFIHHNPILKGC